MSSKLAYFSRNFSRPHFSREMSRKTISRSREKCEKCAGLAHSPSIWRFTLRKIWHQNCFGYQCFIIFTINFSHSNSFEPKLLGNICDSIPDWTIFISDLSIHTSIDSEMGSRTREIHVAILCYCRR